MQQPAHSDRDLDAIFAAQLVESHEIRSWFLSRTKFARLWPLAKLLHEEQREAQGQGPWWRNGRVDSAEGPCAGMFFVFELDQTRLRFALHVESVTRAEDLAACERGSYRTVAQTLMNQPSFLNYMDFETVLLAPQAIIVGDARTLNFDRRIPFETVAGFIPQFGQRREAAA